MNWPSGQERPWIVMLHESKVPMLVAVPSETLKVQVPKESSSQWRILVNFHAL